MPAPSAPLRRLAASAAAVAVAAAGAAGCRAEAVRDPLGAALVTAKDLPDGWTPTTKLPDDRTGPASRPECQPVADLVQGGGDRIRPGATARTGLVSQLAPAGTFAITLRSYERGAAEALLTAGRTALPTCETFEVRDPSGDADYRQTLTPAPGLGDEALHGTVTTRRRGAERTVTYTIVRIGDVVAQFMSSDPSAYAPVTIPDAIVRTALAKLPPHGRPSPPTSTPAAPTDTRPATTAPAAPTDTKSPTAPEGSPPPAANPPAAPSAPTAPATPPPDPGTPPAPPTTAPTPAG
ncbi:hypothetical protein [Yinghuangia seranimata]|uniref:hypothetical protein n=1 Tax=Yinghuangia seranimata TaxID=408067 RepID=UPI00248CD300|nr:hypothetical protein [Yinghuangia seranimata]MDI2127455.1 hypothetical protein [Yinghuangia seranimata]